MRTLALAIAVAATSLAPAQKLTAGNGTIYLGSYAKRIEVIDEGAWLKRIGAG